MMSNATTPLVFFSLVSLTGGDEEAHRAYNRWHALDHRPENLALPGVAWGDRWRRSPELPGAAASEYADTDYVAMYWFREPVRESVRAWDRLGEDSFQWGRGPLIPGVERRMLAFFRPVKGYASPDALVPPGVLPYRPVQGMHVTITREDAPHSAAAHERHAFTDRVRMPALCDLDGVAGAWTFSFSHGQQHTSLPFSDDTGGAAPGSLRVELVYLDGDVASTSAAISATEADLAGRGPGDEGAATVLRSPLSTLLPFRDW